MPLRRVNWRSRAAFERRARAHVALGVFEARAIARERNESYDRFGALRNDLERETMSNVGGEALRAASSAGAVDFVRRVVVEYAHKSEKEMLEVLGGEKQVHIVKLDALLRRIFAATVLKSTKSLDFTLEAAEKMKRQKTSIRRAVEREDEDLASKFTPQDLNAAISRAVVEISKEQEHLDVVTHVVGRGAATTPPPPSSRTSSSPFRDLDSRRRTCPRRAIETIAKYPGIRRNRRCVGQIRVDIPRGVARERHGARIRIVSRRGIHQTRDG